MRNSVHFSTLTNAINTLLFDATRRFLRICNVEYTADIKNYTLIINNGINSAFMLRFETYNYIRVTRIPKGKFEVLFQAGTPEFVLKKLFDYKFVHFSELSRMILIYKADPKPGEVIEIPPSKTFSKIKKVFIKGVPNI